jgi:uncharacterized protein (TIGR02996 family)
MATHDEFLRAVIADPEDDGPRLVYADWLDERGDAARAEFIRLQCELSQVETIEHDCGEDGEWETTCPACGAYGVVGELEGRVVELLDSHGREWLAAIPPGLVPANVGFGSVGQALVRDGTFRRGFVERISCPWTAFRDNAARLKAATPLREVRFTTRPYRVIAPRDGYPGRVWLGGLESGSHLWSFFESAIVVESVVRNLLAHEFGEGIRFEFDATPPAVLIPSPGDGLAAVRVEAGEFLTPGDAVTTDSQGRAVRAAPGRVAFGRVLRVDGE